MPRFIAAILLFALSSATSAVMCGQLPEMGMKGALAHAAEYTSGPTTENRFIVEIRLKYNGSWYRLNSGPRPFTEAQVLHDSLRRDFAVAQTPYRMSLIDLNSGDVVEGL